MLNVITMVGRLTRDPELRNTNSGTKVASFTLACDESRKGPNGEKQTVFLPVSVFGNQADVIMKFVKKGHLLGVSGRITQRKYTKKDTNVEVTSTEVIANVIELMEPKADGATTNVAPATNVATEPAKPTQPQQKAVGDDGMINDDLPF